MNRWRIPALVFSGALLIHLCGAWALPIQDRDEARFAEASREMMQRGDPVVPTFNNVLRLDKPPLVYWCQIVCFRLFGENEFAARFPSALAAALTAAAIYGFGARLFDRRSGVVASTVYALSLQVLLEAKAAVADSPMVFAYVLTTWAGWELIAASSGSSDEDRGRSRFWWWLFYLSMAAGFLAKGPVAFLPVCALFIYIRLHHLPGGWRSLRPGWGIPLCLGVISVWGIPALVMTHGEFLRVGLGRNVLGRSLAPMQGHGMHGLAGYFLLLPYYAVTILFSFWPWTIHLPGMFRHYRMRIGREESYLLCSAAVVVGVFTLVATRLPHYILPAFPALAILTGRYLSAGWANRRSGFAWLAGGMIAFDLCLGFLVFPLIAPLFPSRALALQAGGMLKPETQLASVDYDEPSLIWYFRKRSAQWHVNLSAEEARAYLAQAGSRVCILPVRVAIDAGLMNPDGSAKQPGLKVFRASGIDPAKGWKLDLVMIARPD